MRRAVGAILLMIGLLTWGVAGGGAAHAQDAASAVLAVRMGDHGDKTRYVLEMTRPLDFRVFSQDGNPRRLIIDFPPLDWRAEPASRPGVGLIASQSYGIASGGVGRIVLELKAPARVRSVFFLPETAASPCRFVLDLEPTDAAGFAGQIYSSSATSAVPSAGAEVVAVSAVAAAMQPPMPPARAIKAVVSGPLFPLPGRRPQPFVPRVIAIDPGHGGIDPGATGVSGIREKDITLKVARALRDSLQATGRYRVFLTRDSDIYLKLRERVARAREAGADLFISIHADSIKDHSIRGASVYTLSDVASDREAEMLAARENRSDALAGVQLDPEDDVMASILIDLAQRLSQNESRAFADMLVQSLGDETLLLGNARRQAGFAVLKAPDVPSVLIELGYLSNRRDEGVLASSKHQAALARAIASSIDRYFGWLDGQAQVASGGS